MYLIQILLPTRDNSENPFPKETFDAVKIELTENFGGVTAYVRSPAVGLWKENAQKTVQDDIVIYEVVAEEINHGWWKNYKDQLLKRFKQDELLIRANEIKLL